MMDKEFYIEVRTTAFDLLDFTNKAAYYGGYVDRVDHSPNPGHALLRTIPITEDEMRDLLNELEDEYGYDAVFNVT